MAKKTDVKNQGNQFTSQLMQYRPNNGLPFEQKEEQKPVNNAEERRTEERIEQKATVPEAKPQEKPKKEIKTRCSFAIFPSELKALKHIAYISRIPVSNIIREFVVSYIGKHKAELEAFDQLSEAEKQRVDDTKLW